MKNQNCPRGMRPQKAQKMSANGISTGIEKLAAALKTSPERQNQQLSSKWKELRNRIDSTLMSTNVLKTNDVRQKCLLMDNMTPAEREQHIRLNWGPQYLDRVAPMLQQLATLEEQLAKIPE